MAVNLTVPQLAVALRITASESETVPAGQSDVLTRTLAAAVAAVEQYAPAAPVAIQNEAVVRLASRLYDQTGAESRGGNPILVSGAAYLLARWRTRGVTAPSAGI